jgi:hypothetical protein
MYRTIYSCLEACRPPVHVTLQIKWRKYGICSIAHMPYNVAYSFMLHRAYKILILLLLFSS